MGLDDEDVREILRIIDESDLDELRIETEGFSLYVRKGGAVEDQRLSTGPIEPASEPVSTERAAAVSAPVASEENGKVTIESPMLGTFYRAEGPSEDPFVEVGSAVEADTTVCIIEVMKMMNSVPAGVAGTITEICPANGELVEYGAPLFRIAPTE